MRRPIGLLIITAILATLASLPARPALAGDGGGEGGGSAQFVFVPYIQVFPNQASVSSYTVDFTDPSLVGTGVASCTAASKQNDVAWVTCIAGPTGAPLGVVSFPALIQGAGGSDGDRLVGDVQNVMTDVSSFYSLGATDPTPICSDLDQLEADIFAQTRDGGHLKATPAAQLLYGAEHWKADDFPKPSAVTHVCNV